MIWCCVAMGAETNHPTHIVTSETTLWPACLSRGKDQASCCIRKLTTNILQVALKRGLNILFTRFFLLVDEKLVQWMKNKDLEMGIKYDL